jgi:hypothetical protein
MEFTARHSSGPSGHGSPGARPAAAALRRAVPEIEKKIMSAEGTPDVTVEADGRADNCFSSGLEG